MYRFRLKLRFFHILLTLMVMLSCAFASAQNVERLEEELILDEQRRRQVEEIIRARQEEEKKALEQPISEEEIKQRNLVEVEPNNILPSDLSNIYPLVPYSVRRKAWGYEASLTYSLYNPESYESDFADPTLINFDDLYGDPSMNLLEFSLTYKKNMTLGSLGGEVAYGTYSSSSKDDSFGDLKLNLQQIRLGARFVANNFMFEPYLAPYVGGGIYTILYREELGPDSFNGNTLPAPYWYAGVLFQLDWLDRYSSVEAYTQAGIENTFVFLEARQYMSSEEEKDPDFSTAVNFSGGVTVEF